MRFHADGPSIPSELLEARDRGNVVFFCGAGVSRPAGLPSFPELARRGMKALGTDVSARRRTLLEQADGAQIRLVQKQTRTERIADPSGSIFSRDWRPTSARTATR